MTQPVMAIFPGPSGPHGPACRDAPHDDFLTQTPVSETSGAICWFSRYLRLALTTVSIWHAQERPFPITVPLVAI
jgi:hypothetical protein